MEYFRRFVCDDYDVFGSPALRRLRQTYFKRIKQKYDVQYSLHASNGSQGVRLKRLPFYPNTPGMHGLSARPCSAWTMNDER